MQEPNGQGQEEVLANGRIQLPPKQRQIFEQGLKAGVFHALYDRGLLTDSQLDKLLR